MFELRGKYNTAKIFTDNVEATAQSQIVDLCNQGFVQGSKIRIMPDTHAGAGCTIGTTMTITDKVVPNLVGVDIGCGMQVVELGKIDLDLEKLDKVINEYIPSGFSIRKDAHPYARSMNFSVLKCKNNVDLNRAELSIGTLGGGNHFIEANVDDEGNKYIVVHTGSRNLGKQVAEYYQEVAHKEINDISKQVEEVIAKLKSQGRENLIESEVYKIRQFKVAKSLAYLQGDSFKNYLDDMTFVQAFSIHNRGAIINDILRHMDLKPMNTFTTIHNYIDMKHMILRKGAVSAQKDERLLIPINMRDGSLICIGKGNEDWNYSAPHGAGRLMSRGDAKRTFSMEEYQESMQGIYTTSVNESTLDESPMAYKPMQEIIDNIQDTVDIVKIIKPIYNFKAGE